MKDIRKDILLRVYIVYIAILIFGLIIISKAVSILVFEKDALVAKAKKQEIRIFDIEAIRGNICSDDGTLIATSVPIFDIRMDVLRMKESPEYRIEISKEFANVELSAYIIRNEQTVFNDIRDSYHFMFGLKTEKNESYLKFYISYDNRKYLGLGIGFII